MPNLHVRLNDEERAFAEADAAALGMDLGEYIADLIRDELASSSVFDMDELSQAGDRQWKSH